MKMLRYEGTSSSRSRSRHWGSFKYPSTYTVPSPSCSHPVSHLIISHAPKSRRLFCSPAPVHSYTNTSHITDNPTEAVCKKVLVLQDFVFHVERTPFSF